MEVVVVDGGSKDRTIEVAEHFGAMIVRSPKADIPLQRNLGIQNASNEVIAFLDADCTVSADWLSQAARYFREHDRVVVGALRALPDDASWVARAWDVHWRSKLLHLERNEHGVVREQAFRQVTTQNLLTTASTADLVGGFDERLKTGEDSAFCYKAHQLGVPVVWDPRLEHVHHSEPRSLAEFFRQQVWHSGHVGLLKLLQQAWHKPGGLNVPVFAFGTIAWCCAVLGTIAYAALTGNAIPLLAVTGVGCATYLALAARTCIRMRRWVWIPAVAFTYFVYGVARGVGLLGLGMRYRWR